jgi:hypothetical protein
MLYFSCLQNLSQEHVQRMATILWSLWKHRNLNLWENENELCANVVDRARHLIEDWQSANIPFKMQTTTTKLLQLSTLEVRCHPFPLQVWLLMCVGNACNKVD